MEAWRQELYLAHHGILGMKWGKRQGPPYPLGASDHSASEKKAGWRKSLNSGSGEESKPKKRLTKADTAGNIKAKKPESGVKKALSDFKSDYREGLKAQYLEKHNQSTPFHKLERKTEADAEKYAEARMKTIKALAIVGGVAITAVAAKYAYDHVVPQYVDRVIKEGTEFERVTKSADSSLDRAFYAARSKGDAKKYIGLYADQFRKSGVDPYQVTGEARKALKIASNQNAAKTFRELYEKDSEFKRMANDRINHAPEIFGPLWEYIPEGKVIKEAMKRVNTGKTTNSADFKNLYEVFNFTMSGHGTESDSALRQFYDALKKKGYGAINDINDQKYSGYNTNTANIVFDVENVVKTSVRKLENQEIDKIRSSEAAKNTANFLVKQFGLVPVLALGAVAANTAEKGKAAKAKKGQQQKRDDKKGVSS